MAAAAAACCQFQMPMVGFVRDIGFDPQAPVYAPPSEHKMRADAAEFIPMFGGLPALPQAVEARQQKQKRQMPPATDEEWETRIAKREKEVVTIKSLQSYRMYLEVFPHDKRGDDDPKTPDPRDKTVSKRMWKWNVEKWRLQLKSRCVYSRAVALQCREYLLRQERREGQAKDASTTGRLRAEPAEHCPGSRLSATAEVSAPPGFPVSSQAQSEPPGGTKLQ
mmetsp:Transcript_14174/g.42210  ORF Transcript_14174/g.42210 Transcript_14174/m.42210 type:complete len:222 (-) Transcript_14174:152-817(-)